jgi:hypothetical protein
MKSIILLALLTGALSFVRGQDSMGTLVMWGAHVTHPQNVTMTLGLVYGKIHSGKSLRGARGIVIEIEPGLGGIRGNIGYGTQYRRPVWTGGFIGATVLHTWRNPGGSINAGRTYVGMGSALKMFFLPNLTLALYYAIDPDIRRPFLISAGLGFKW